MENAMSEETSATADNGRMMRKGLAHLRMYKDDMFFRRIDETGGWPVGFQYVGFEHTTDRDAGFSNNYRNSGWWTTLYSADDYYLWKLSPETLQRIIDATISAARITPPRVGMFSIETWNGRYVPPKATS
jgi:hypothetical protein